VSEGAALDEVEATDVEQQALLPSVRDTKLWMVKCRVRPSDSILHQLRLPHCMMLGTLSHVGPGPSVGC